MSNRIAFYCSSNSWGGLEMNFIKVALWLQNKGYDIKIYCVANTPISADLEKRNLEFSHVARNRKYYDFKNSIKVYRQFKQDNIEAIWSTDTRDLSLVGIVKTLSSNKMKLIYHQAMQLGIDKKDLLHTIRYSKIDAWITLLPFLAEQIKTRTRFKSDRIYTIPLAVDLKESQYNGKLESRKRFNIETDKYLIGIIGRLTESKGQLFAVKELAKLRNNGLDLKLLFVGEGTKNEGDHYIEEVYNTIENLGLTEHVYIHPFIHDTKTFYQAIDLFVMASHGETFGTVTIEAMKCGVPVLGTNSSGTPEILENGNLGFLYEVNDGISFGKQINYILDNPVEVSQKTEKARSISNEIYSIEFVSNELQKVLNRLNIKEKDGI